MSKTDTKTEIKAGLVELAGEETLSYEWRAQAEIIDFYRSDSGQSFTQKYPDTVNFAQGSSTIAREFSEFTDYPEAGVRGFTKALSRHILLYESLIGIHGVTGRETSFFRLAKSLEQYKTWGYEFATKHEGEWPEYFQKWRVRLLANVWEELGLGLGDEQLLSRALKLNRQIVDEKTFNPLKGYKIHAAFSEFDINDHFIVEPNALERLELARTPEELQEGFYSQLVEVCEQILQFSDEQKLADRHLRDSAGTLTEIVILGYLRDTLITDGIYERLGARQAFIHEDNGRHSSYQRQDFNGSNVPNTSFDLSVYDRQTGERIKIDAKKDSSANGADMQDIVRMSLKLGTASNREFMIRVLKFAMVQRRRWRHGLESLRPEEREIIDKMYHNLDFASKRQDLSKRIGRVALEVYGL